MKERSSFTSRIGFVLAAAGSAVGLGNMWRFPYLAAKYGGGAFLITYVLLAVTFGFTLMITEVAMGRRTRMSCIEAFGSLNRRFAPLGWLAALIPVIIAPYYCVIGGWGRTLPAVLCLLAVFLIPVRQILCHIVDELRHADSVFDGLVQDKGDLRRIPKVHRLCQLAPDKALGAL